MSNTINKNYIKDKAAKIITDYMGSTTAKAYYKFYETQDDKTVLISLEELLAEYLGASSANKILTKEGLIKK